VEALLFGHPKVREVAVIDYSDQRLGERACAVVVPQGQPPSLAHLTAWLADAGMAKQFWPERLEVVDSMPKTPSGKFQKFYLREPSRSETTGRWPAARLNRSPMNDGRGGGRYGVNSFRTEDRP